MQADSVALLIGFPSLVFACGAAIVLWLIRLHHLNRAPVDAYCLALERDMLIACGMSLCVSIGTSVAVYWVPSLSVTPLPMADGIVGVYTMARLTGLLIFAGIFGIGAFVARRLLWWLGLHPLQRWHVAGHA